LKIAQPFKAGLKPSGDQVPKGRQKSRTAESETPHQNLAALWIAPITTGAPFASQDRQSRTPEISGHGVNNEAEVRTGSADVPVRSRSGNETRFAVR